MEREPLDGAVDLLSQLVPKMSRVKMQLLDIAVRMGEADSFV